MTNGYLQCDIIITLYSINSALPTLIYFFTKKIKITKLILKTLTLFDASQGIEAQTLANTYLAVDHDLEIIPVINKIDLPSAEPERVIKDIEDIIGIPAENAARISAKTGLNVGDVMENIVRDIPAPVCDREAPLQALIFDSYYDAYKGVIVYFRVKSGVIHTGIRGF